MDIEKTLATMIDQKGINVVAIDFIKRLHAALTEAEDDIKDFQIHVQEQADELERLYDAIECYEGVIGYIEDLAYKGLNHKNMSRYLTLKQIHSRIKFPDNTLLEDARDLVAGEEKK